MLSPQNALSGRLVNTIDCLRGIAIIMVIVTHTAAAFDNLGFIVSAVTTYSRMGVQLFFVMSAFTLMLSATRSKYFLFIPYFVRRFFRIWPLYILGVAFYGVLLPITRTENLDFSSIMYHSLLLHAFDRDSFLSVVPGGWSIGVEILFYILFPALFLLYRKVGKAVYLKCAGLSVSLLVLVNFALIQISPVQDNVLWSYEYWSPLNQMSVFLIGMSTFALWESSSIRVTSFQAITGFLVLTLLSMFLYYLSSPVSLVLIPILSALSFACLFHIVLNLASYIPKFLCKIGKVSFSMYLVHFYIVWEGSEYVFEDRLWLFIVYTLIVIALSYLVSTLTERIIEKPGIAFGKKVASMLLIEHSGSSSSQSKVS